MLSTSKRQFAHWLANELSPLASNVTTSTRSCDYDDAEEDAVQYVVRTCTHDELHAYRNRWYTADEAHTVPVDYTPTMLGLWCAYTLTGWTDARGYVCLPLPDAASESAVRDCFSEYYPSIRHLDDDTLVALEDGDGFLKKIQLAAPDTDVSAKA